jgi:aminoglycoside phosphotransferase (APT) family kinase protein
MRPLPRGYTNQTVGDASIVRKTYVEPDAAGRCEREHVALQRLARRLPVPPLLDRKDGSLTMRFVDGIHGQDLLEAGYGSKVLRATGEMLARIQDLDIADLMDGEKTETPHRTLVHGDYGPNNLLIDPTTWKVVAILDWEWWHLGDPVEDLAWCEFIVRMFHPAQVGLLSYLFQAHGGDIPPWKTRHAAMLTKCRWHLDLYRRWDPGNPGVTKFQQLLNTASTWLE